MRILITVFSVLVLIVFGVIEANAIDQSICHSGANVVLYPNGSLKSCVLKDSFRVNEIKCNAQSPVSFYDNGRFEACVLAEPAKIGGQECRESAQISFYPDGKLRSCVKKD